MCVTSAALIDVLRDFEESRSPRLHSSKKSFNAFVIEIIVARRPFVSLWLDNRALCVATFIRRCGIKRSIVQRKAAANECPQR